MLLAIALCRTETYSNGVGAVGLAGSWQGSWVGQGGWVAVTPGLIQQIPGKDGGVILVADAGDAVHAVQGVVDMVLVDLHDPWV